jgi:hypothetical protein
MGSTKRTLTEGRALKSFDLTRSGGSDTFSVSLDHPVRSRQHVGRYREADLLGSLEIDQQLKLRRLLDWKVSGFCTIQDFVHVNGGAAVQNLLDLDSCNHYVEQA